MKSVSPNLLALFLAVLFWDSARVAAQVPPTPTLPPPQVSAAQVPETWLMLKNGSTFAARMLSAGERVKLRVNGGDIEIRASEIALTGYSLSDLAEQQWALLHQAQLDKQLPFIDWCTRYQLYDMADAALVQMAQMGQDPPRIAGYQARLKRLREIHQQQTAASAPLAAASQSSALPAQPMLSAVAPPAAPPQLVRTEPVPNVPAGIAPPPTHLLPPHASNAPSSLNPAPAALPANAKPQTHGQTGGEFELNSASNNTAASNSPNPAKLSPAAVELFAARVQPWVVSRCSNSGCHDMNGTNNYKLERYSKQEAIPRATTMKNLAATTRLILADKPEESPLLVMAGRAHGTSLTPPITAGDGQALTAFREFVALASGRELPKETKPDPLNTNALNQQPGQVTPGRATFPASAAEGPAPEDKSAALLKQTGPGWQAAIERQKAYDLEAQRRKDIELSSQKANEARGLLTDPAVKPAAVAVDVPATPTQPQPQHNLEATLPSPALPETKPVALQPAPSQTMPFQPQTFPPSQPQTLPGALPESLLPKSLAAKPKINSETVSDLEAAKSPPLSDDLKADEGKPLSKNLRTGVSTATTPAPPINLNRPRRMFPLPPEDNPTPSKGVGMGDIKRR